MSAYVTQVQASLAHARDTQVARVVAMVDALPDRGVADALIAPLRPRLAVLRPARPPGFTRVLFTPLDSVIVPLEAWRQGEAGVPRPALSPLGAAVRGALPGFADMAGYGAAALWPAAACVLDGMAMPRNWETASGLAASEFIPIRLAAAAVLHEAAGIEAMADGQVAVDDAAIWAVLSRSKARGAVALEVAVCVLLARLPCPDRVAALAAGRFGHEGVIGRVVDRLAGAVATRAVESDAREAAKEAARVAALLSALENGAPPERRARLDTIRREADAACRRSFGQAVAQTLALAAAPAGSRLDDEAVAALEGSARGLQRLATAARGVGSGGHYEAVLADTAAAMERGTALGMADRVRLLEILVGTEPALALLAGLQADAATA